MKIIGSKLYYCSILCPGIVTAAIMLTWFISPQVAQAAAGDLDPTFGIGGMVMTDLNHSTDIANAVAVQADGKLVVVGTTYKHNDFSDEDFVVTRYNTDGTLDNTFGSGGRVRTDFPGLAAVPSSVVIQPDGKIVVAGGAFPLFTFLGNFELVRYNPNGSLDRSFGNGGIVTTTFPEGSYASAVALQADGKIIAAGTVFVDFIHWRVFQYRFCPGALQLGWNPGRHLWQWRPGLNRFCRFGRRCLFGLDPTRRKDCRGRLRQ